MFPSKLSLVAVLGFLVLGCYAFYLKAGLAECNLRQQKEIVQANDKREKIQRKVMSLDDVALRDAYCKWMRDDVQKCRKSDLPISER